MHPFREVPAAVRALVVALLVTATAWAQESRTSTREAAEDPAIVLARQAVVDAEVENGPDSTELVSALRELGRTFFRRVRPDEAGAAASRAVSILERSPATPRGQLAEARMELVVFRHDAGRLTDALPVARAAAGDALAAFGPDDRRTAKAFRLLGGVAKLILLWDEAEAAFRRTLLAKGLRPAERIEPLQGLGECLMNLGRFGNARAAFSEADALIASDPGLPIVHRVNQEGLLGVFEANLGRYGDARAHFERQLALVRSTKPVRDEQLCVTLHSLAQAVMYEGRFTEARRILDDALAVFARQPRDPRVMGVLIDAARVSVTLGDSGRCAEFAERVLAFMRTTGIDEPHRRGQALQYAAIARHAAGRPEEALPLFDESLDCARRGSTRTGLESRVLGAKGRALSALGRTAEARASFRMSLTMAAEMIEERSAMLSEAEHLGLLLHAREALDAWLSSVAGEPGEAPAVAQEALRWKGRVLRSVQIERSRLRTREGPDLLLLRNRLARVQEALSPALVWPDESRPAVSELIAEREEIERALARLSAGERPRLVTPEEVARSLGDDEALVDYLAYDRRDMTDARWLSARDDQLLAVVYRHGQPPRVVPLGTVAAARNAIEGHVWITARDVRPDPAAEPLARSAAAAARDALWSPLAPTLVGVRRVFIVADSVLAALPFETLPSREGSRLLVEDHEIVYLLAAQDRVESSTPAAGVGVLLVGDVDYGEAPRPESRATDTRSRLGLPLSPLPRTRFELDAIASALAAAGVPASQVVRLVGSDATESRVKQAAVGKRVVHLATHGLFLRDDDDQANEGAVAFRALTAFDGSLPALRSGVALAGVNGRAAPGDDGLLTASEVAWYDLSGCDLAVVSSCESGMGIPRAGDSLIGLRRSLRLAGARATVTALWKVDDAAAADLMRAFYEGMLIRGLPKGAALREAKLAALESARARGATRGNPGIWGGFVLEGSWK